MKKLLAILLTLVLVFSMVACGGDTEEEATETYTVGVVQLVEHVALDAATQGFCDALADQLGDAVSVDVQLAQGEANNCATIVNNFVSAEVDLIMANATAALQAAVSGTDTIPVLGTSITAYDAALGIEINDNIIGGNVSGTSDLAPLDEQAAMLVELFPEAKTVGMIWCTAEANSQYQIDGVEAALADLGLETVEYSFTDSNDIASVVTNAVANCDVLYIPTDNTCASNTGIIDQIARPAGVPIIAGEEGICSGCGVATLSISYYDLGYQTGLMAAQILTGEADVSTMPIQFAPNVTREYNAEIAAELNVTIPEDMVAIGAEE